jgi:hypothetical protein
MKWARILVVFGAATLVCSGAFAMFRVASMVVIPTAASTSGLYGSNWHTDLEIMNVDTVDVDVQIVMLKCCGVSNVVAYENIANSLGGRDSEGFGKVDAQLAGIKPGQAVYLNDVVQYGWGSDVKGSLLVFGYEAGTLTTTKPPGGNPKLIMVNARTYSLGTDASNNPTTFGTQVPGLPWYDYIDPAQTSKGYDHATFTGLTQNDQFRTAVGLINVSDELTTLTIGLSLNAADGTKLAGEIIPLGPLAMVQYDNAIVSLFGQAQADNITGATMTISVISYTTGALNPAPALMAYVTRMDNTTNDPVYIEQAYTKELPWDCVYNGNCSTTATALGVGTRQPFQPHLRAPVPAWAR